MRLSAQRVPPTDSTAAELYTTYADHFRGEVSRELKADEYADTAACLRADAARFAAHKAVYVERTIADIKGNSRLNENQRQQNADAAMRTFHRWGETEAAYVAQTAQMAGKWHDFERDGDKYLLQYRTAYDEKVRAEHAILNGVTLPASDSFWNKNYPPLGWNCRCTVVQVHRGKYPESDSEAAQEAGKTATQKTPAFRFNPGKEKKLFPESVSYYKHAGADRKERDKTEKRCEDISKKQTLHSLSEKYVGNEIKCNIGDEVKIIQNKTKTIKHFCEGLYGKKDMFWLKNEITNQDIISLCKETTLVGKKVSDTTHNTNKDTVRLKKATDYFFYYKKVLPNNKTIYLHIGKYRETGNMYLYDATDYNPIKE